MEDIFGPVLYAYTRAQAIADGVLVEIPELDARLAGLTLPVALNSTVWRAAECDDPALRLVCLRQCVAAIAGAAPGEDRVYFSLARLHGDALPVVLHCGPGDRAEPVLTLCQPDEV